MAALLPVIATCATWGPSVYFALGAASTLIMPAIIKSKNGPTLLAKDAFPEVFDRVEKLRKDILIYRVSNIPYAAALGTNFGPAAVLFINKELSLTDKEALNLICKHELSHINGSDGFVASSLAAVVSAISTYAVPYLQSCLPWWAAPISYCVPFLAGANTYTGTMAVLELEADRFASCHATSEELIGIERFLRGQIEVNKTLQPKYPQLFSVDGNTRLASGDITHGPITERHERFRAECRKRNLSLEEESSAEQFEKMSKIKEFHRQTQSKFSKLKVD